MTEVRLRSGQVVSIDLEAEVLKELIACAADADCVSPFEKLEVLGKDGETREIHLEEIGEVLEMQKK